MNGKNRSDTMDTPPKVVLIGVILLCFVGLFILFTGFIFSLMMFYVGYISIREMYSNESKITSVQKKKEQKEKIARLYPQS